MKSFTEKIWFSILAASAILMISLYIVLNFFYRNKLMDSARIQYQYEDELLTKNAEIYADTGNSCMNMIIVQLNQTLNYADLDSKGYPSLRTATQSKIYNCLLNSFSMFQYVEDVAIVWQNGVCFYQGKNGIHTMYSGESRMLEKLDKIQVKRQGTWINFVQFKDLLSGNGLYCVKPYTEIVSGVKKGYVVLKIKEFDGFAEMEAIDRNFYLFSADGLMLQTNDIKKKEEIQIEDEYDEQIDLSFQLLNNLKKETEKQSIWYERKLDNGWCIVSITSMTNTMQTLNSTVRILFIVCAVILLIMFALVGQSLTRAIAPIHQLSEHMAATGDRIPEEFRCKQNNDETGVLINSYNRMIQANKELVAQLLEGVQREKKLEFSLLQAQIKPHFLYNTLDTIYCLNAVGRYTEASVVVKRLSEYYRLTLNKGLDWVLLDDELKLIQLYLEIQSVRYKKNLSFIIECDSKLSSFYIPKLLLQPLVENAIEHGIKPTGRPGCVRVNVTGSEDIVEIRIQDNGIGFQSEQFNKIISQNVELENEYGLRNVAERLKLYYNENCQLKLEAVEEGTSILIRIANSARKDEKNV